MLIVSVDGVDCMGKSTYCNDLKNSLIAKGDSAVIVHFPRYEGPFGQAIKDELYKENKNNELLQELCIGDFEDFTRELNHGKYIEYDFIILDRSYISTLAYNNGTIKNLNKKLKELIDDNRIFKIDSSIVMRFVSQEDKKIVAKRLDEKKDKDSNENINYLLEVDKNFKEVDRAMEGYLNIAYRGVYDVNN